MVIKKTSRKRKLLLKLQKMYDEHKKIRFPTFENNEKLYDIFSELATYDGFIAGAIDGLISGKSNLKKEKLDDIYSLQKKFAEFHAFDKKEKKQILELEKYFNKLENLKKVAKLLIIENEGIK
ncbi:hypothetical protein HY989_01600 [Candidatus Micrarchaeota archaeon]|nr:hypothetical protein [Candidatus Micrarchaeota archaeon]